MKLFSHGFFALLLGLSAATACEEGDDVGDTVEEAAEEVGETASDIGGDGPVMQEIDGERAEEDAEDIVE